MFFDEIGWTRTFGPLVLPRLLGHNAFYIFLYRQFFRGIPEDIYDAARIDGCSEFGVWWRIFMPMSRPVLAAISIFAFSFAWNDFLNPLIYLGSNKELWTLALGLNALQGFEGEDNSLNMIMTFSMLMIIPMLIVFYFGQKHLISARHRPRQPARLEPTPPPAPPRSIREGRLHSSRVAERADGLLDGWRKR